MTAYENSITALRLDRRQWLAGAAALGLSATSLTAATAAETPKKGGTLRVGMEGGSASDSLDPRTLSDSIPMFCAMALWNFLVEIDNAGNAVPELAESWEAKPGAAEWTFKLRKGIHFGSGKEFDADDAIYSINLHRGETKSAAKDQLSVISEIKKVDSHTITCVLTGGNADFPYAFADYHLVMVPNGFTDFSKPDGTGHYTLETFEPGVRVVMKAKPGDYWKPGRGNFDAIDLRYILDTAARTQALISGQVDVVNRLNPKTAKLVAKSPNITIVQSKGNGLRYDFVAHRDTKPFDNVDVMLGLKYGIDRQKIVDTVFSGFATVGNDHLVAPSSKYFDASLPQRPYDPEKAAFHFKKAGMSGPFELEVSEGAYTGATDSALLFQESLKKAGATLNIKRVSGDGYWSNVWLKSPFCAAYWGSRPTVDLQLSQAFLSDAAWNDTKWKRPDFDKLVVAARAELDDAKRKEMYGEAQRMISDDGGLICFAISDFLDGYSKKVRGAEPHARYDLNDLRITERGWFA